MFATFGAFGGRDPLYNIQACKDLGVNDEVLISHARSIASPAVDYIRDCAINRIKDANEAFKDVVDLSWEQAKCIQLGVSPEQVRAYTDPISQNTIDLLEACRYAHGNVNQVFINETMVDDIVADDDEISMSSDVSTEIDVDANNPIIAGILSESGNDSNDEDDSHYHTAITHIHP